MTDRIGIGSRWENLTFSKTAMFWSCAACVAATLVVGFTWGGWVTQGSAGQMAASAASGARAELAATICVDRFARDPDAVAQLASLQETRAWNRSSFIEKGGWATLAGAERPVAGAADLCAKALIERIPVAVTQTGG